MSASERELGEALVVHLDEVSAAMERARDVLADLAKLKAARPRVAAYFFRDFLGKPLFLVREWEVVRPGGAWTIRRSLEASEVWSRDGRWVVVVGERALWTFAGGWEECDRLGGSADYEPNEGSDR